MVNERVAGQDRLVDVGVSAAGVLRAGRWLSRRRFGRMTLIGCC
jgi:hypothetical protein